MNDDTKPLAPAPIRTAMARSCARVVAAVGLAAAAACAHVKTGAKAGDCSFTPVREVPAPDPEHVHLPPGSKVPIPESIFVSVDPSNPGGACKGKRWESGWMEEPCPAYQGPIILETVTGDAGRYPTELEGPLPRPVQKPVLFGHTLIIPGEQTFHDSATEKDRDATGRMTALITRMRMPGGKDWPVCGVLFFNDGKEGIPILAPNTYDGPATPGWYRAEVKFYWPTP